MPLDQTTVLHLVQQSDGGFNLAQALSMNVFLFSALLLWLPTILTLLIATTNKSILTKEFMQNNLLPELLRFTLLLLTIYGITMYYTSLA